MFFMDFFLYNVVICLVSNEIYWFFVYLIGVDVGSVYDYCGN